MSANRKKRLSLIDFFGKSSDSTPARNAKKNSHQRASSSDTSKNAAKRLTFQIPDESIVSHVDLSAIPKPPPAKATAAIPAKKKYAGLQNNANTPSNNSNRIKGLPTTSPSKDPVSQKENTNTEISGPYGLTPPAAEKRLVSNSSLSSSMYPTELSPVTSLRNTSNSTLPDFSRQTSSIYPPSTFAHDNHLQSTSGTISKRSDLLRKRKPPPPSLKVKTAEPPLASTINTQPPSDLNHLTEYDSTDSEFTPLNLIPPSTVIYANPNNAPLAADKQLNPSRNVMFAQSTTNYEPPKFHQQDDVANDSQNQNAHKHSRTLSSIEEITSALNSFQLEHEKSFTFNTSEASHRTDGDTDGDAAGGTLSFTSSPISTRERPIALNFTQELENHNVSGVDDKDLAPESGSVDGNKGIFVKVKDLPELKNGETLDQYIDKLKTTAPETRKSGDNSSMANANLFELEKPKSIGGGSENSSASDVFFDVDEPSKDVSLEDAAHLDPRDRKAKGTVDATPQEMPADVNDEDAESEILDVYSNEDLIGPLDDSFESFVKQVSSRGDEGERIGDGDGDDGDGVGKYSETQTISTSTSNIPEDIVAEDGVWHRYSSATNFFNDADQLQDGQIVEDDDDENGHDALYGNDRNSTHSESSRSLVLTPTDSQPYVNMGIHLGNTSPHRNFDLGDELENNVTAVDMPDVSSSKSLEDLYPTHSSDDINDEDDEDEYEDDEDDDEDYDGYERYNDDDNGSYVHNAGGVDTNEGYGREYSLGDDHNLESKAAGPVPATSNSSSSNSDNNNNDDDDGVLEFSPRSPRSVDSIAEMAQTPDIFRHNSMCSRGMLEKVTGMSLTGTPTGLGIGAREHLVITNQELDPLEEVDFNDRADDEARQAPIPDIESNFSAESLGGDNDPHQIIYDRREEPTVMPIQHSLVVIPAAPVVGTSPTLKKRRPPPNYPSTGRRGRGLSETTANPEMFVNGIAQQLKPHTNGGDISEMVSNEIYPAEEQSEAPIAKTVVIAENEEHGIVDDVEARKGEKCTYIESLRLKGKKTTINMKPSMQVLPVAIRQNGTISHKKIPSQQLTQSFKSHKHVMVKPKTRMLASEIDDGELPDATLIHRGQKTKVPIHPDAAVIAASEQFNRLAKQQQAGTGAAGAGGDLGRFNSVLSVRPHYGNGMRLFITNPDSDDD